MEEKGTDTNKNKSTNKSNYSSLYLFDDAYHKVKAQQKSIRCKSASIHKKIFSNATLRDNLTKKKDENKKENMTNLRRHNFFSSDLKKEKNNKNDLQLFSVKSRNKLNSNIKTINLSNLNLIKSNDSMKLDSTKQTSKRTRIISGKFNSSYSFNKLSNSMRKDNSKKFKLRNKNKNNNFSIININADNCDKKETNMNKTTLKDLAIQKLIKKSKTIEFDRIIKSNKSKSNKDNVKYLDFYSSPVSYYLKKEKKYNIEKKFRRNNDDCKDADMNTINNYPIKYSFMDDTMNNIFHMVNFIDMQNKEELYQNVIIDFKNKNEIKFEDFKTYGYEFSPEILYKINQDEKQKLIKMKLEEFKKKNATDNSNEINPKKLQRPKFKKNYIPEFKLKFKNPDWNKKQYESIYKFHSIKYTLTPKKNMMLKKKIIKNNNVISRNSGKYKSMISHSKNIKYMENLTKERNKEKKSKSFRIDMIENKEIKSVLKNNENTINKNYSLISEEDKNEKVTEEIPKNDNNDIKNNKSIQMNKDNNNNDNNKDSKKDSDSNIKSNEIKSSKNELNDNTSNKINMSSIDNSSSFNYTNIQKYYKILNQKKSLKDYNKINKVVKVENIFLKGGENNKYEHLDISEYVNRINSTRRYQKRNSFNFFRENDYITSTKNITRKSNTNISSLPRKKHKTVIQRKSAKITFSQLFKEQNNFNKLNEERQTNINFNKQPEIKKEIEKIEKNKKEDNLIPLLNIKEKKEETKIEVDENKNKKNLDAENKEIEEEKNDEYTQKNILEKIDNENKHHEEHKRSFVPFYRSQREISEDYNKIEINFISNKSKFVKRRLKTKSRKNVKEGIAENLKPKREEIIKKQGSNIEEAEDEDTVKKLEERLALIKGRRMNKSATLDYINQKYKEIEAKKDKVDINEEITENLDKLKFFRNVDLESIEDIEYNKNVLLYKLREDIKYKISIGTCDKTELEEYFKFESKLNEYKVNYNLKDKDKIREYVLLLLVKFNEFMELLSIRESRKNEENRINKFVNNLNYELDYNIPMLLMAKGRKCHSRNYEGYVPSLSELKK